MVSQPYGIRVAKNSVSQPSGSRVSGLDTMAYAFGFRVQGFRLLSRKGLEFLNPKGSGFRVQTMTKAWGFKVEGLRFETIT